jgi:hypothetical protein
LLIAMLPTDQEKRAIVVTKVIERQDVLMCAAAQEMMARICEWLAAKTTVVWMDRPIAVVEDHRIVVMGRGMPVLRIIRAEDRRIATDRQWRGAMGRDRTGQRWLAITSGAVAGRLGLARISAVVGDHRSGRTTIFEAAVILAEGRAEALPAVQAATFAAGRAAATVALLGRIEVDRAAADRNGRAAEGRAADPSGHAEAGGVVDHNGRTVAVVDLQNGREVAAE